MSRPDALKTHASSTHLHHEWSFHRMLLEGKVSFSMGLGLGESKSCILLLRMPQTQVGQPCTCDETHIAGCKATGTK